MPEVNTEPNQEPIVTNQSTAEPNKKSFSPKRVIITSLIGGIVLLVAGFLYYISVFLFAFSSVAGTVASTCNRSQVSAEEGSIQLAHKLDLLNVGNDSSVAATHEKYGDCFDTISTRGDAFSTYRFGDKPYPLLSDFHQTVRDRLQRIGYTAKTPLALLPIGQNGGVALDVTVSEDYSFPSQPDLNVAYVITPHTLNCSSQPTPATYDQCFAVYKATFSNLGTLTVSSLTAKMMTKEFPNH